MVVPCEPSPHSRPRCSSRILHPPRRPSSRRPAAATQTRTCAQLLNLSFLKIFFLCFFNCLHFHEMHHLDLDLPFPPLFLTLFNICSLKVGDLLLDSLALLLLPSFLVAPPPPFRSSPGLLFSPPFLPLPLLLLLLLPLPPDPRRFRDILHSGSGSETGAVSGHSARTSKFHQPLWFPAPAAV